MPRTLLALRPMPVSGGVELVGWTAFDAANGMALVPTAPFALLARNDDAVSHAMTVKSVANLHGRLKDVVVPIPAGAVAFVGPLWPALYRTGAGVVELDADSSLVKVWAAQWEPHRVEEPLYLAWGSFASRSWSDLAIRTWYGLHGAPV